MHRLLYFTAVDINPNRPDGVAKKVLAQLAVFGRSFGAENIYLTSFSGERYVLWSLAEDLVEIAEYHTGTSDRRKLRLASVYPQVADYIKDNSIDCLYLRSPGLDVNTHAFFKRMEAAGVRAIMEIPTWPFWREKRQQVKAAFGSSLIEGLLKTGGGVAYWVETHRLRGLLDSIVTFADVDEIWGLPALGISNGYDFDAVPTIRFARNLDEVHLVVAATLRRNHGIDRIIKSVSRYGGKIPVVLHVAGEGEASEELRELADSLGLLGTRVVFHGFLSGNGLHQVYSISDIGVSALGFHRYGVMNCSPLKTKEYLAFGLPCLGTDSERDIIASEVAPFYLAVPSDETPIDMESVVDFVMGLRRKGIEPGDIRRTGRASFSWDVVMAPVIERFER